MIVYLAQFWYLALILIAFVLVARILKREQRKNKGGVGSYYKDMREELETYNENKKMENWKF